VKWPPPRVVLLFGVGPVLVLLAAFFWGFVRGRELRGRFERATAALSAPELKRLEAVPALAAANAAWALGSAESVKRTVDAVLERLPPDDSARRARALLRFGLIDENLDGQAAVFGLACAADPGHCDDGLERAAERETKQRFVSPGNYLPLYFGGHPPLPGPN
jgi:hypothetical protein